jgi:hydroxymethylbilane synthase
MAVDYFKIKIPEAEFELVPFKTLGDKKLNWSLEEQGGKGLFTKELEEALLDGRADFAVHSAKDMPTVLPDGLAISAYLPRDEVNDTLIIQEGKDVPSLIATGSPRRRAQLKKLFPAAVWSEIRGNVESRLKKIALDKAADATLLSWAGLERLGIESHPGLVFKKLKVIVCVPAVGQGAIAIECRNADVPFFEPLGDAPTALAVSLEREFLAALGGGCQVAYGAYFDGTLFHIFHEKTGYQKIDLSACGGRSEMSARVRLLASGLI